MYETLYQFFKESILSLSSSPEYSYLMTNNFGLILPSLVAILSFLYMHKKNADNIYPIAYIISILGAFFMHFSGFWMEHRDEDNYNSLNFISIYPMIIIFYFMYNYIIKKKKDFISISWMYLGTFSSLLFTDVFISYYNKEIPFKFDAIGGAGLLDGLVIAPLWAVAGSILLNILIKREKSLT